MRKIKYRLWENENNKYYEPTYEAYKGKLEDVTLSPSGDLVVRTLEEIIQEIAFPHRFIIEQFTGLLDKNGVEIYFNDLMETADKRQFTIFECLGELKNGASYFGIAVRFESGNEYPFDYSLLKNEVIGNIHDKEVKE